MEPNTRAGSGNDNKKTEEGPYTIELSGVDDVSTVASELGPNKPAEEESQQETTPQNVALKPVGACSQGCVPVPCMYHKIGKTIVWLGPKRPYNLKWPLTCYVGPDFGCMLCTYSLFTVPSVSYIYFCFPLMHGVANGIFCFSFGGLFLMYTIAACSDPGVMEKNDPNVEIKVPEGHTLCKYCNVARARGTVHCYECDACIIELDHHCPWTGKCIGKNNLFYFYGFLSFLCLHLGVIVIEFLVWLTLDKF